MQLGGQRLPSAQAKNDCRSEPRTGDAAVVGAADVFRMATVDGAEACGFERVGRIAEGWRADLVVVPANSEYLLPWMSMNMDASMCSIWARVASLVSSSTGTA